MDRREYMLDSLICGAEAVWHVNAGLTSLRDALAGAFSEEAVQAPFSDHRVKLHIPGLGWNRRHFLCGIGVSHQ